MTSPLANTVTTKAYHPPISVTTLPPLSDWHPPSLPPVSGSSESIPGLQKFAHWHTGILCLSSEPQAEPEHCFSPTRSPWSSSFPPSSESESFSQSAPPFLLPLLAKIASSLTQAGGPEFAGGFQVSDRDSEVRVTVRPGLLSVAACRRPV